MASKLLRFWKTFSVWKFPQSSQQSGIIKDGLRTMELEHSWTSKGELLEDIIDNWLLEDFTKRSILAKNIFVVLSCHLYYLIFYIYRDES